MKGIFVLGLLLIVSGCAFAVTCHAGVAETGDFGVVVRVRVSRCAPGAGAAFGGGAAGGTEWRFWWWGWEPAVSVGGGRVPCYGREKVFARGVVGVVLYQVLVVVLCLGIYDFCRVPARGEVLVRHGRAPYSDPVFAPERAGEGGRGGGGRVSFFYPSQKVPRGVGEHPRVRGCVGLRGDSGFVYFISRLCHRC